MKRLAIAALIAIPALSFAQTPAAVDECFTGAATRYSISKPLLVAIGQTESKLNPAAISPTNSNGTFDIGLMQINSSWLPKLKKYGVSLSDLRQACTSIYVGAWIMANNISVHGSNWNAVGAYNAASTSKRQIYVAKVQKNLSAITLAAN